MTMKLWHCHNARSLRPLWALEEMGLDYELEMLPFPPRFFKKEYLGVNVLGTVPFFEDGDITMTESTGICHYLVEKHGQKTFSLTVDHPEYGDYLNWLYHSDATLTFPQTIVLRYSMLEPEERKLPQAVQDYSAWFIARLRKLDAHIENRKFLCDERFTIADIAVGYALHLGQSLGLDTNYTPQVADYLKRLQARPAFIKAAAIGAEDSVFK
ncbi:MAG: glutathione S-transferase family protein [Kordiimonadaceae bacterium]|nr:glutathione S-transferase family protein [Kordiimonadaceae bacterium]